MNKKQLIFVWLVLIISLSLSGCVTVGPSVIKTYNDFNGRSQIAILRVDQKAGLTVIACDDLAVPRSVRYILLQPGRHEVLFNISGQNLLEIYRMTNKKYLDVIAGHTYILKSKGGGIFSVGISGFPRLLM